MKKSDFYKICDKHSTYKRPGTLGSVLGIRIKTIYTEYCVVLKGSWGGNPELGTCILSERILYKPNQKFMWSKGRIEEVQKQLEKEASKYLRWLLEWSRECNATGVVVETSVSSVFDK